MGDDFIQKFAFLKQCTKDDKFDIKQINQIGLGVTNNLTIEQIKLYATPEFNANQMEEIRGSFEDGLTMKQIKVFAKPEFRWNEIKGIRIYLNETGLTSLSAKECRFLISIGVIDTDFVW